MLMFKVLQMFSVYDDIEEVERFGRGFINRTYYVKGKTKNYILQVLDCTNFENPDATISNITSIVDHLIKYYPNSHRFYDLYTKEGERYIKLQNTIWHGFSIPKNLRLFKKVINDQMMTEIGKAIGLFHKSLMNFSFNNLKTVNSSYHRYDKLESYLTTIVKLDTYNRAMLAFNEVKFIKERLKDMHLFSKIIDDGLVPLRITHNNIRLNNILFEDDTYNFAALIGYDVISVGSILYDIGDTIRHLVVTTREDEANLDLVQINLNFFAAFIRGYIQEMKEHITTEEIKNIVEAGRILTLEEGLRYIIDFLDNDRIYKADYHFQNLERARNRLQLVRDIEQKNLLLNEIINKIVTENR